MILKKVSFVGFALSLLSCCSYYAEGDNSIVVQVLGTPASGKSIGEKNLLPYFSEGIQRLVNKAGERAVDLDKIRESYAELNGTTYFFLLWNALDLFSRATKTIQLQWVQESYDELRTFVNNKFRSRCKKICNADVQFEDNGGYKGVLKVNGKDVNLRNIGTILKEMKNLDKLFASFNLFELGNIMNRYEHLRVVMDAFILDENIKLDNVGTSAAPVIGCLKTLRDKKFLTLTIMIHPQTPLVNLLLNSLRAMTGGHYTGPDMLLKKYCQLEEVTSGQYMPNAEKVITVEKEDDYKKLQQLTANMTVADNDTEENRNKEMDLLVIDKSNNIEKLLVSLGKSCTPEIKVLWRASVAQLYDMLTNDKTDLLTNDKNLKAKLTSYIKAMMTFFANRNDCRGDEEHDIETMKNIIAKSDYVKSKWNDMNRLESTIKNFYKGLKKFEK